MPLSRYLVRNEYGLADPDLYRVADKDDPEALLEGVAMAGLVGVLRQLGDLAEFAAEMFHDLHEEVMATAARGHALIARVQQLEAEFPLVEKTLLSQTSHMPFLYKSGIDWHPNIHMDENLVTQGDMPRFVMDSYEECRGPPRLFLLDKFDVAGAGACLKRYTDPSFFKAESADSSIKKSEGQREKRIRKVKRRGPRWRNGDTPEVFPSSHAKLHQLLLEERIESGGNDPERRVKLKKRPLDGFHHDEKFKSYMQKCLDTCSPEYKVVREISLDLVPMNFEPNTDTGQSGLELVEIGTVTPRDKKTYSSLSVPEVVKSSVNDLSEVADGGTVEIPGVKYEPDRNKLTLLDKDVTDEELAANARNGSEDSVGGYNTDDIASEIDNYVDALATMESEFETDSDYRTKRDMQYLNNGKKMIDSDGSEEQQEQQNTFLDYHSVDNSTVSDNGSLLKKDIDSFSCSDNVSNFAESTLDGAGEATAKFFTEGSVNSAADDEKSVLRGAQGSVYSAADDEKSVIQEPQGDEMEEHIAAGAAKSMGKNSQVKAELNDIPWNSVKVGTGLTNIDEKWTELIDRELKEQAVLRACTNDGFHHPKPTWKPPVEEMANESSYASADVGTALTMIDKKSIEPTDRESKEQAVSCACPSESYDHPVPTRKPPLEEMADERSDVSSVVDTALTNIDKKWMGQTDPESKEQAVLCACPNDRCDHPMPTGKPPLEEIADERSEATEDVLLDHSGMPDKATSHSQSEYAKDGQSTLFYEMRSSSASSPAGKPIQDLRQPVGAVISDDALPCSGDETNIGMVSMADDGAVLLESTVSLTTDNDVMVEPKVSTAASNEDSSDPVVDHADIEHPAVEDLSLEKAESTARIEFDSSQTEEARSVDVSSDKTVCESISESTGKTTMNGDSFSSVNLVVNPSQIDSQLDQVSKITGVPIPFDGEMAGAGSPASPTVSYVEEISKSSIVDEVDSDLNVDTVRIHNDYLAMYPDQPGPARVSSNDAGLMDDASESLWAEGAAVSFDGLIDGMDTAIFSETVPTDSPLEHLPEGNNNLDIDISVSGLEHAETKVASARHDCLNVENTETERQSLSSVLDCSSTWYANKQHEEYSPTGGEPCQNSEGSQLLSLKCHAEVDLQNPASPRRDERLSSDSIDCDTSKNTPVLRLSDNVNDNCLAEGSQEKEAPLSSIACDKQLERSNSRRCEDAEDKKHGLDELANVDTNSQIAPDEVVETQGVEITVESFSAMEATSQPLEYAGHVLPPESGDEIHMTPTSVSSLSAPLSQPLAAVLPAQSGDDRLESQPVDEEPSGPSGSISPSRELMLAEVSAQAAYHNLESIGRPMEQSPADFSSISLLPDEAQASLKIENPGQTMGLSQVSLPLFSSFLNPVHFKPAEMPPLPPLPPMEWRLGRNQHISLPSKGLMQHPIGTVQPLNPPETSDDTGLRSQKSVESQHWNPFLSSSGEGANLQHVAGYSGGYVQQPVGSSILFVPDMFHEGSQQHTTNDDQRQDAKLCAGSQDDLLASDTEMDKIGLEPLESGLLTKVVTSGHPPAFKEEVIQKETAVADEQFEHISSEPETTVVGEKLEHGTEKEIATPSAQSEPLLGMQYGHQFTHGFISPEAQGTWSTDIFGTIKPENANGNVQKKIPRPRNPLIDAVVALDKSKLRKVGEIFKSQDKPEAEKRDQHLPQLRKVGERVKSQDAVKAEESFKKFPPLRKIGERVKPQHLSTTADSAQHLPQLRKVEERNKSQNSPTTEENTQHLLQLRKVGEITKHQDGPKTEEITQHLPQLRKIGEKIKPQDEPEAEESKQNFLLMRSGGKSRSQDGPQVEDRDSLMEQIRNKSFNLKPAATSRPSVQGPQTNLKVAAILEKANTIRQAMAGSDEDDSDGWSDH